MAELAQQWKGVADRIAAAGNGAELDAIEQELFGRKSGLLTMALKELGALSPDERRTRGQELNAQKETLTALLESRKAELQDATLSTLAETDRFDVTIPLPTQESGHLHLIPSFMREVEDVFGRMGFDVERGPEVEEEDINFTKLNIPPEHPARDMQDTFWLEAKKGYVLRTHTSNVQIRYMQNHTPPFRMICPGRVYRKDSDATHSPMFHQFEGLMIGKDVSLANMKAVMETAIRSLVHPEAVFRFRASYFPFVEPGLEVDMRRPTDDRWLEVAGCGMVHPNVLTNVGIDPGEWQGFAFGFGVERLLMIKHAIRDMRSLFEGDVRFVGQF